MKAETHFLVTMIIGLVFAVWLVEDGPARWITMSTVVLFAAVSAISQQVQDAKEKLHQHLNEQTSDLEDRIDERIESRLRQFEERERLREVGRR